MAGKAGSRALCLGLVAAWLGGCGGADGVDEVQSAVVTTNALTANALTANALTANALTANALTANGLRDPLAREFLKYVVSCALPADQSISLAVDGTTYEFSGSLGLAPEWGGSQGSCDESCQRWVSGCVLARVDAVGRERTISIRGENRALRPTLREIIGYPVREASYFGNVFVEGQPRYLCLAPGKTSDPRVCGPSLDNCPMTVVGSCAKDCAYEGVFDAYVDCSTSGHSRRPEIFHESVTVFLPKQAM